MKQAGRKEFVCEPVNIVYLGAFTKEINPEILVNPIKVPPKYMDGCEWKFSI